MTAVNESAFRDDRFFEELYAEHFHFLVAVAVRKFRVPDADAESLAHEVFLSYLRRGEEVLNVHSWMLGAICHASRYYWRQNGRLIEPLDDDKAFERPDPATTPPRWSELAAAPELHSSAAVEQLIEEVRNRLERSPADALTLADVATSIAESLPATSYPAVVLAQLRAMAWKERANTLRYLS